MRNRLIGIVLFAAAIILCGDLAHGQVVSRFFAAAPLMPELPRTQPVAVWLDGAEDVPSTNKDADSDYEMPSPDDEADDDEADEDEDEEQESDEDGEDSAQSGFDPQVVSRGQSAFQDACTQCHDADRSLEKRKSRAGWLATVRRMARMDGADINSSDMVPIATYLASLNPSAASNAGEGDGGDGEDSGDSLADMASEFGSSLSLSSTISTLYRGGNDVLENPGFFVDAWVRADWQPSGPIRGRVTACTSCHGGDRGNDRGFTLEFVEAAAALDLMYWAKKDCPEECHPRIEAELKAGRFVVPFGAFASMSHPGVYRTLTNPLMYDMGRSVDPVNSQPPVLPMPYSDEGADLFVKLPLLWDWNATLNAYAVNGLRGANSGIQFTPSRGYSDNNSEPAVGGRATVGNKHVRLGGSVMSGRMQDDDVFDPLHFRLAGGDATARFFDGMVRLYFEYAMRQNDTALPDNQLAYGTVSEMEVLLLSDPNLSAMVRYDTLEHRGFFGDRTIERFTWGFNTTTIGGSLLILNHERWNFPYDETDIDVVGFRWVATF